MQTRNPNPPLVCVWIASFCQVFVYGVLDECIFNLKNYFITVFLVINFQFLIK